MEDLIFYIQNTALCTEYVSALLGMYYFRKYRRTSLKIFVYLLLYAALNEILCVVLLKYDFLRIVNVLYNIYIFINFICIYSIFYKVLKRKAHTSIVKFAMSIYIILFISFSWYENYLLQYQNIPYLVGATFVILSVGLYFSEVLNSSKVLRIKENALFWISIGWLLFFVGNIPFWVVRNYYDNLGEQTYLFLIILILGIIMNILFWIGLKWGNKKYQY